MTQPSQQRLAWQALTSPDPPGAAAAFAPYVLSGSTVHVSGQIAIREGHLITKRRGPDVRTQRARPAGCRGRIAERDRAASEDHDVRREHADLTSQPQVADGASRLFLDVLGGAGEHAPSAIGVAALPPGTPVEVGAIAGLGS